MSARQSLVPAARLPQPVSTKASASADAVAALSEKDPGAALALLHAIIARNVLAEVGAHAEGVPGGWSRPTPGSTLRGSMSQGRLTIEGRQAAFAADSDGSAIVLLIADGKEGGYLSVLEDGSRLVRGDGPIFARPAFVEGFIAVDPRQPVETFRSIKTAEWISLLARLDAFEGLLHAAVDVGLLRGFAAAAHDHITTRTRPWQGQSLAKATDDPHLVRRYGEYLAMMQALNELFDEAKAAVFTNDRPVAAARAYAILAGRTIINGTIELLGAGATSDRFGFDLFWRDFMAHAVLHPPLWPFEAIGRDFLRSAQTKVVP